MPTAISLFSGCGGDTLGLTNAGYEVIAFSEFNKAAIQTHERNFPNSTLMRGPAGVTDITKIPDTVFHSYAERADVLFAGFPCFVKDTLVLTDKGYIPIQEVTFEHQLLTHTGNFKNIVNLQKKLYSDKLYDIKIKYHPTILSATKEHPFYIRRLGSTPEWKEACNLSVGDYVGMPVNKNSNTPSDFTSKQEWYTLGKSLMTTKQIIPEWVHDGPTSHITEFLNGCKECGILENSVTALHILRLEAKVNVRDEYVWYPIDTIVSRQVISENVYNFEVADDNSYCVENVIVHNCQGFSRAGKKKASDPRNQLFQQFVRATRLIRPKMIIGENVTGLRTMKSGPNPDDPMMLDIITQAFRDIGYTLTHQLVEIVQFGVPQKRKRILILGWPIAESTHPTPEPASLWASITTAGAAKPLPIQRTFVTNSMEGAYRLDPTRIPEGFEDYALVVDQDAEPSGTPHPFVVLKADASLLSCSKRDSPVHSEVIDLDSPSKTIICTYDHQPRLLVGLRKPDGTSYVRILLPDELKQIQGFPVNFVLLGNKKEQVTQVGNAVPPPLIECVGNVLKNYI
jgi:DNA (cytosine-5)-methyltransferase 1